MSTEARARIDSHRLMKKDDVEVHDARIDSIREELNKQKGEEKKRWKKRAIVNLFVFVISFILATGILVIGTLIFVRPDNPMSQIFMVGLFSVSFISAFAWLRIFILHTILNDYPTKEEDPGMNHHLPKSIAYGFVGLVIAVVLIGFIVNVASADFF